MSVLGLGDVYKKQATEWGDALQNAPSAGLLALQLKLLPPHSSGSDEAGESLKQIKWLLDLIDLSENLPDRYIASSVKATREAEAKASQDADRTDDGTVSSSSEGGDK